jgi:hypothetical protein
MKPPILTMNKLSEILFKSLIKGMNYDICRIIYKYYSRPNPKFKDGDLCIVNINHQKVVFKIIGYSEKRDTYMIFDCI